MPPPLGLLNESYESVNNEDRGNKKKRSSSRNVTEEQIAEYLSLSWDGNLGSVTNRTSNGGRRSRRNSSELSSTIGGTRWKKKKQQLRAISLKPFKLRIEEKGKMMGEEFMKKVQEMMIQPERQQILIAQGLPWTTDEPECLIKPPGKESIRPSDPKLHTDVRAVERAKFDH